MASSIPSILGRNVLLPAAAILGGAISNPSIVDGRSSFYGRGRASNTASCETATQSSSARATTALRRKGEGKTTRNENDKNNNNKNPFLAPRLQETVLRKRMTSVGRFSLKSETEANRSIPTYFLALSGEKRKEEDRDYSTSSTADAAASSSAAAVAQKFSPRKVFTVADFEDAWLTRDMPARHPRFHSTVCPEGRYFEETHRILPPVASRGDDGEVKNEEDDDDEDESSHGLEIKAELDRHASETMHFSVYREDLRNRLEHMLTSPLEVSEKMWEVKISNGPLGSSGAIGRAKADAIREAESRRVPSLPPQPLPRVNGVRLRRNQTRGGSWEHAVREAECVPTESVLLFRSHHALADGASTMAALADLCDEAEEIRADIEEKMKRWKRRKGGDGPKGRSALRRLLARLARILRMWLWLTLGTLGALAHQGYLQLTTPANPFDAVREDAERKGLLASSSGRSISWCDAAPLEEAKRIAEIIGKSEGMAVTINDIFVSCVTSAVARQLAEHAESMAPADQHEECRSFVPRNINVVVPVHLRGGVVLPGESVGNNIGAFVARCPGEMKGDAVGCGGCGGPTERLRRVHRSLSRSKRGPAPFASHRLAKFCSDNLPEEWTKSIFRRANANACVVVSNNRGHDKKLHIRGMTVESAHGFLPLPPGIPVGVVVQSYAGTMSLSVAAERWAVPDADRFLRFVLDEYCRLRDEAFGSERRERR